MSMRTYANHGYVIPKDVLRKELPDVMEYLDSEEEDFSRWVEDDYEEEDESLDKSIHFQESLDKIKAWGASKGLELSIDYTNMDEDNEDRESWLCFCENAYTLNPAFKDIGGESTLWTTYG